MMFIKNKFTITIILILSISIAISVYFSGNNEPIMINTGNPAASGGNHYETLNELTEAADHIVIGTVIKTEVYNDNTPKYIIRIDESVKGVIDDETIDVFSSSGLSQQSTYFLFLDSYESEYANRTRYVVMNPMDLNPMENGVFIKG